MIQRIQTIYLLLATIASIVMGLAPLGTIINKETMDQSLFGGQQALPILILGVLCGCIAFGSIFLFKNRKLQLNLVRLNAVLVGVFIAICIYYLVFNSITKIDLPRPGIVFPLFALFFNILGMRGIIADEKLIKSMDRLR
jgi:drug/metabolite transporter (DMT)-like permease